MADINNIVIFILNCDMCICVGCVRRGDPSGYRTFSEQMRPVEQRILDKQKVRHFLQSVSRFYRIE